MGFLLVRAFIQKARDLDHISHNLWKCCLWDNRQVQGALHHCHWIFLLLGSICESKCNLVTKAFRFALVSVVDYQWPRMRAVWLLKMWPVSVVKGLPLQEFVTGLHYSWRTGVRFEVGKKRWFGERVHFVLLVSWVKVCQLRCSCRYPITPGTWCSYIDNIWLVQRKLQSCKVLWLWLASALRRQDFGKLWNILGRRWRNWKT